jgi:hypothetical protein
MNSIWMSASVVLVVLLISLISISSAAGLRAMPELYRGQCGEKMSVPAPGILKNDIKSVNTLQVLNPEKISIDPKYGTLKVNADGSFDYSASQDFPASTYVYFYYRATDGISVSSAALVKIAVSCICHGAAPDVAVPMGTRIVPDLLMQESAGCMGCRDVTPKFDLSKIPAQLKDGTCYPYTVYCPGGSRTTGQVCFEEICEPSWQPFTVCRGVTPTAEQILAEGMVSCNCDLVPEISNIHLVDDHWEYSFKCSVDWLPSTLKATGSTVWPGVTDTTGIVYIEPPCEISVVAFSVYDLPTPDEVIAMGDVSCGSCDVAPVISNIRWISQPPHDVWTGEYTITCAPVSGCSLSIAGQFDRIIVDPPCICESAAPQLYACKGDAFPMGLFTSLEGGCRMLDPDYLYDPDCFDFYLPEIDDSQVDYNATGDYPYTVICGGCPKDKATGQISIREQCDLGGEYCNCETISAKDS